MTKRLKGPCLNARQKLINRMQTAERQSLTAKFSISDVLIFIIF